MGSSISHFLELLGHELKVEFKNKQAITSLLIYSVSTIYISYLSYRQQLDPVTWNALFWIIMLFAATNAIARSFLQESRGLQIFYYTLLNPSVLILAKTCYNILILCTLGLINLLVYSLLFQLPVEALAEFLLVLFLGCFGLSSVLTLVSGIVSRAQSNSALVAILGFPLLFPLIITLVKCSQNVIMNTGWESFQPYLVLLLALNSIILTLSYILFPYLWRE